MLGMLYWGDAMSRKVTGHCPHCHNQRELAHYLGVPVCEECYRRWLAGRSLRSAERRAHARRQLLKREG